MAVKKIAMFVLAICLLAGCASVPEKTTTGDDWCEEWVQIGPVLGAEDPKEGDFVLQDNKDALAVNDLYFATWVAGNREDYVNEEGNTVDLYEGQLYVLVQDDKDVKEAQDTLAKWQQRTEKNYNVLHTETLEFQDQIYTIFSYAIVSEDNPYDYGVSAFGLHDTSAICAELLCRRSFEGDAERVLESFLEGLHYAA